jgi:hypothetical protein
VDSWDGYSSYLLVFHEASQYIWVFVTKSKEPPLDILDTYLDRFGHEHGGLVCTDQGGELTCLFAFSDMLLRKHNYVVEPTGAASLSQNGAIKIYNAKLAVCTQTWLFGSGLPEKYWLLALIHLVVYLHNILVHNMTWKTPFEAYFGVKPDLTCLKLFGSRVCVKRSGSHHIKLDQYDFKRLIWGCTAMDQNIVYLDLDFGVVKTSHHVHLMKHGTYNLLVHLWHNLRMIWEYYRRAIFHQSLANTDHITSFFKTPDMIKKAVVPWPPVYSMTVGNKIWVAPDRSILLLLPLRTLSDDLPRPITTRAACTKPILQHNIATEIVADFEISKQDLAMVYMSPDPYHEAFEQTLDLCKFDLSNHSTAGLSLHERDGCLHMATISPSTPAAKLHEWCSYVFP